MDYRAVPTDENEGSISEHRVQQIKRKPVPSSTNPPPVDEDGIVSSLSSMVQTSTAPEQPTDEDGIPVVRSHGLNQWTPVALRKRFMVTMAGFIISLITILVIITFVSHKNEGFPGNESTINNVALYLPTVIVIIFGFTWQRLVLDVKKVFPWSILASGWSPARQVLFTGYVGDMEILSLWRAWRSSHWAIFVALSGGFLSGLLVVFANTLLFLDLQHSISNPNFKLHTTSRVEPENMSGNISMDPLVVFQPIIARRMYQGGAVPWTTDDAVFDSFGLESSHRKEEENSMSLVADALGHNPTISCDQIQYRVSNTTDWLLESQDGRYGSGVLFMNLKLEPENEDPLCPFTHNVWYKLTESRSYMLDKESYSVSWLNTTNCGGEDNRLLITSIKYIYSGNNTENSGKSRRQSTQDGTGDPDPGIFHASGLRCKPILRTDSMLLTVNETTDQNGQAQLSKIQPSTSHNQSTTQSLGAVLPGMLSTMNPVSVRALFLRNGTEFLETEIISKFQLNEPYFDDNGQEAGISFLSGPPYDTFIDPWFYILTEGNITKLDGYRVNLDSLEAESQKLFSTVWIHILDLYARQDIREPLSGSIVTQAPRLVVSNTSAWSLVAIFIVLLAIISCLRTVCKPKTHLSEDPGTLAAISVLLAKNTELRELFRGRGSLREENIRYVLSGYSIRTVQSEGNELLVEVDSIPAQKQEAGVPTVPTNNKWRPASLHPLARITVMIVLLGCIVTLLVLLMKFPLGFSFKSERTRWLIERIPITILVILGYALAGTDSAIQSLQPYRALQKGRATAEQTLLFKAGSHSVFTVPYLALSRARDAALFASALSILVYPAVKIAAAGLFSPTPHLSPHFVNISVDDSFSAMLAAAEPVDFVEAALYKNAYTLLALEQIYNVSDSPNFIGSGNSSNLVIGNLTQSSGNDGVYELMKNGGQVTAILPALKVVISCNSTGGLGQAEFEDGTLESTSCYKSTYDIAYSSGGKTFLSDGGRYTRSVVSFVLHLCWGGKIPSRCRVVYAKLLTIQSISIAKCDGQNKTAASGVWCEKNYQQVDVNVTLRQRTLTNLGQKTTTALEIDQIDMSSVVVTNSSLLGGDWIYPVLFPEANVRTDGGYGVNDTLEFDNMTAYQGPGWNTTASMAYTPTLVNILLTELTARGGNIDDLLDPAILQHYMEKLYLAFHIHAIDQLRTLFPVQPNPFLKPAEVITAEVRLQQSPAITIVVCALLGAILILALMALLTIQGKGIVNMPPTTLASQLALLSDSSLVDEVRSQGVTSVSSTRIWQDNRFALGWISDPHSNTANVASKSRLWGVDFSGRVHRRD